jgi:hypothetical protein
LTGRFYLCYSFGLAATDTERGFKRSGNTIGRVGAAVGGMEDCSGGFFEKQLVRSKNMNENSSLDESDAEKFG